MRALCTKRALCTESALGTINCNNYTLKVFGLCTKDMHFALKMHFDRRVRSTSYRQPTLMTHLIDQLNKLAR